MDSLVFSLNATIPIFLVIVIGYGLRRMGVVNQNFVEVSNKLNFNLALPALLFQDLAFTNLRDGFDAKLVLFCATVTTIAFFGIWFLARRLVRDSTLVGAFVQASYRCSVAVMGVALMQNIYGGAGPASMMIIGSVPLFNIYAVLVLSVEGKQTGEAGLARVRSTALNVIKNPLLIGIVLGCTSSLMEVRYAAILVRTLGLVSSLATPQALLCIGAGFEGRKALAKLKPTIAASLIKLVVLPALFLPVAVLLGFRNEALVCIVIMLGTATTPSSYVMAERMGNDGVLTSSVVVLTTLLSALTLTFWLFLVRQMGFVG